MRPFGVHVAVLEPSFFETPICSDSYLKGQFEKAWDRLSEDTKEEYGLEYLDHSMTAGPVYVSVRGSTQHFKFGSSPDITPVIDAYFHALTAVNPKSRYTLGVPANL